MQEPLVQRVLRNVKAAAMGHETQAGLLLLLVVVALAVIQVFSLQE